MEHPEGFEFQQSRNEDYAQISTDMSASHSLSGLFFNPWATTFDTAAFSDPSFQPSLFTTHFFEPPADNAAWSDLHPINFVTSGYPSTPPCHTPIPTIPPEDFGQPPYDSHLHDPPSVTPLGHPDHHPPFVLPSQYTGCDLSSPSQAQSSPYVQHPSLQHLPNEESVGCVTNSPPHTASIIPSMASRPSTEQLCHRIPHRQQRGGILHHAHDFVIKNAVMYDNSNSANFMPELLKTTIGGAEFDSSDRDPPPQCHPGTRLSIINRTQCFITNCGGKRKIRWIVGPAGVGKSAIMQTLAEKTSATTTNVVLGASIFFSIKGRDDATKAITTLAYQLAVSHLPYRQIIEEKIAHDPSLLSKSMAVQFNKFIVEPFSSTSHHRRLLILIDGLDECASCEAQCKLLELISSFCLEYPASSLAWVIASRPEPHITSFFSQPKVTPAYEKEEIQVDEDGAREDVERFLRDELRKIQMESFALRDLSRWPTEHDFLKLADASSGLFACASTIVKYINDPAYGNPASQLCEVLEVIDSNSRHHVEGKPHPMAHLDALYTRILSGVPADVMVHTRKLLLMILYRKKPLSSICNWLGMTKDTAYSATYHLRSVLDVPEPDKAMSCVLDVHHKSFTDYLRNFERSKFCLDVTDAFREISASCARRVLKEAPSGVLEDNPDTFGDISLSWPSQDKGWSDDNMRFEVYLYAAFEIVLGLRDNHWAFLSPFFIHTLTAFDEGECLNEMDTPILFRQCLFDESRRSTFMEHKVLKQIQVRTLDPRNISKDAELSYRFQCPAATIHQVPNPWDPLCEHDRYGSYKEGQDHDWHTDFFLADPCSCSTRLLQHLEIGKTRSPDDLVTVFINFRLRGFVEYRFIDTGGSMAEWTYFIPYNFSSLTGMQSCSVSGTSKQCDVCSK